MKTIKGDLVELAKNGEFDVIAHGTNCFCTMGAGIAKSLRQEFPAVYKADLKTKKGDLNKLGTCCFVHIDNEFTIVNAYIQYDYGRDGKKVNYDAVRSCMKSIKKHFPNAKIGLPKIGAGLAGGDWNVISEIIEEELKGMDVTLVVFEG